MFNKKHLISAIAICSFLNLHAETNAESSQEETFQLKENQEKIEAMK